MFGISGWTRLPHPMPDPRRIELKSRSCWLAISLPLPPPPRFFSEVFILKGFKSCVLEVRILKGLGTGFL